MSMVVRNNLSALNTLNTLNRNHTALSKSLQTVSSGMRINSAKDDASGYAISERMRVQIRSLNQDNQNTQNGHSMMKVAEGAVQSTVDILKTLKEKVINAANDTNTDADRAQIQKELDQSIDQINDNANVTYNGKYLVDGSKNGKSNGTRTALTNDNLSTDTIAGTLLTNLKDRNNQNLNIQTGDQVTVSFVKGGKTYSKDLTVTGSTSLASIMSAAESACIGTFAPADASTAAAKLAVYEEKRIAYEGADGTGGSKAALKTAEDNLEAFKQAKQDLKDAFDNLYNNHTTITATLIPYGQETVDAANQAFDQWAGLRQSSYIEYPSFDSLGDTARNAVTTYDSIRHTTYGSYYSSSYAAYSAYSTLGSNPESTLSSIVSTKRDQARQDEEAMNNAYADYLATNAPEIKTTSTIGTDYFGKTLETSDKQNALTITAASTGVTGQIAGFTISVTDKSGNIKKSVNAALDAWTETIRAENARTEDNAIVLQTGTKANQAIKIRLTDMRAQALGLQGDDGTTLNVGTQKNANAAINVLDNAIQKALDQQTSIGAIESRLEYTSTNLTTATENVTASESTLRDADMAKAMTEYTKNNILAQSSQAMLAQANQSSNQVLSLLQ